MSTNNTKPTHSSKQRTLTPSLFVCVVLAFGLLLWARFILVTGHPRTAIADPIARTTAPAKTITHADK